jgi:hypothetical protein
MTITVVESDEIKMETVVKSLRSMGYKVDSGEDYRVVNDKKYIWILSKDKHTEKFLGIFNVKKEILLGLFIWDSGKFGVYGEKYMDEAKKIAEAIEKIRGGDITIHLMSNDIQVAG